tara:strand:+ start:1464 stop:1706 length:243 start_codon:yes stop_codon:yes gene_type:complete
MAEQYDNTNRFVLFKNNKQKETQPDYTGNVTLEGGKEMQLSAWIRESAKGVSFLSGQVSEKYVPNEVPQSVAEVKDDIPF